MKDNEMLNQDGMPEVGNLTSETDNEIEIFVAMQCLEMDRFNH